MKIKVLHRILTSWILTLILAAGTLTVYAGETENPEPSVGEETVVQVTAAQEEVAAPEEEEAVVPVPASEEEEAAVPVPAAEEDPTSLTEKEENEEAAEPEEQTVPEPAAQTDPETETVPENGPEQETDPEQETESAPEQEPVSEPAEETPVPEEESTEEAADFSEVPAAQSDAVSAADAPAKAITSVTLQYTSTKYSSKKKKPAAEVYCGNILLTEGTDYTVTYKDNVNVGTASAVVQGIGAYTGKITSKFKIIQENFYTKSAVNPDRIAAIPDLVYNGNVRKPKPEIQFHIGGGKYRTAERNVDYTLSYLNNVNAGTATLIVTFKGNYTGTYKKSFKIKPAPISSASLKYSSLKYNGKKRTQTSDIKVKARIAGTTVTLTRGTDYTVSYKNNLNAGTATAVIKGTGNYTGTISKNFTIEPVPLTHAYVNQHSFGYNGMLKKPDVTVHSVVNGETVKLKKGTEYTVTYKNNRNIGTASAIIVGTGNFYGKITKTFNIHMIDYVAWAKSIADDDSYGYGHDLPTTYNTHKFSCSTLVGGSLYLCGYITDPLPQHSGWMGGWGSMRKGENCLETALLKAGFEFYTPSDLGTNGIASQSLSKLRPGDVMWRCRNDGGYWNMHVGIYMGDGLFVESRGPEHAGYVDPNEIGVFPEFGPYDGIFRLDGSKLK